MSDTLVQVEHLQQYFPAGGYGKNKKYIQAVDDVSFTIERGETLGLVVRQPREELCFVCMSRPVAGSFMTVRPYLMSKRRFLHRCFLTVRKCRLYSRIRMRVWILE